MLVRFSRCTGIDRDSSDLSETLRIWHLKCFKKLELFVAWDTSVTGSTKLLQEDERLLRELTSHLHKKLLLPHSLMIHCMNWNVGPTEK